MNHYKETSIHANVKKSFNDFLTELIKYRALFWVFAIRDIKVRYAQTIFGFAWVIFTPIITVGVFTFVFGLMIKVPTDGLPYVLFYLVAIVPWYAFIGTLNNTIGSIEGNATLVSKIYFPRLVIGGSYAISTGVDYLIGFVLINVLSLVFGLWNYHLILFLPILLFIQALFALGIGYFLVPLNTRYRDVKHIVPLCLQFYYFSNPILYSASASPPWLKPWYAFNPMSTVITSYREILRGHWPNPSYLLGSAFIAVLTFAIGVWFFNRNEQELIDHI